MSGFFNLAAGSSESPLVSLTPDFTITSDANGSYGCKFVIPANTLTTGFGIVALRVLLSDTVITAGGVGVVQVMDVFNTVTGYNAADRFQGANASTAVPNYLDTNFFAEATIVKAAVPMGYSGQLVPLGGVNFSAASGAVFTAVDFTKEITVRFGLQSGAVFTSTPDNFAVGYTA